MSTTPPGSWKFEDTENTAVITLRQIVREGAPVLHVVHDDDGWQFLGLEDAREEDAMVVALRSIVDLDPSLEDLSDLPEGWRAYRQTKDAPWHRERKDAGQMDQQLPEATVGHLRLAGMALAHALWSIEYGDTLCTLAMLQDGEDRSVFRFEADSVEESVEEGLGELKSHLTGSRYAALIYDGFYTDDEGLRTDALIVELLASTPNSASGNTAAKVGRLVQRYAPGKGGLFKKTRIRILGRPLAFGGVTEGGIDHVIEGAMEHEKARDLFAGL